MRRTFFSAMMKGMIGQHKRNLAVVPYQSGWIGLYEQEATLLGNVLGQYALRIEHIGSTSVPGLAAKAIIDIVVGVPSLAQAVTLIPLLEGLGYEYKDHDTIPERLFFAKESAPEYRTHHLNLTALDSSFWKNHIIFRDTLRTHDQIAGEYVLLKRQLAAEYAQTNKLDPEAKTPFVTRVLALSQEEENSR